MRARALLLGLLQHISVTLCSSINERTALFSLSLSLSIFLSHLVPFPLWLRPRKGELRETCNHYKFQITEGKRRKLHFKFRTRGDLENEEETESEIFLLIILFLYFFYFLFFSFPLMIINIKTLFSLLRMLHFLPLPPFLPLVYDLLPSNFYFCLLL